MAGIKVLIIEDNPGDVLLMKTMLRDYPEELELHFAADGSEGLAWLRNNPGKPPAFLIIDQTLPGLSGSEVIQAIRGTDLYKHVKIAMFSSSDKQEGAIGAYTPDKFIVKQINYESFQKSLFALLDEWL